MYLTLLCLGQKISGQRNPAIPLSLSEIASLLTQCLDNGKIVGEPLACSAKQKEDAWKNQWSRQKSNVSGVFVACHSEPSTKDIRVLFSFGLLDVVRFL